MTLDQEVAVIKKLNAGGILATLDHLGESVTSLDEARASRDSYLEALRRIASDKLQATISIKLTQFGLDFGVDQCLANVRPLVQEAQRIGAAVEIDMEASRYVDQTLDVVQTLHREGGAVRAVVQAYLRRTYADTEALCDARVPVRLVKGAYKEPPTIAFATKQEVDAEFTRIGRLLIERGVYPAIATHDPELLADAIRHAAEKRVFPDKFEFQMLYGIRRDLQDKLLAGGYRLRLYVPYGEAWYPYFMRRLAERPANLIFLLRNLVRR
jgi:proline dehydrogenase